MVRKNISSSLKVKSSNTESFSLEQRSKDAVGSLEGWLLNDILHNVELKQKGYDDVLQDSQGKIIKVKGHPKSGFFYFIEKQDEEYWLGRTKLRPFGEKKKEGEETKEWIMKLPVTPILMRERFYRLYPFQYKGKPYLVFLSRSRKHLDGIESSKSS